MKEQLEIICVGNELLIGKVLNTNGHWMAKRATSLGTTVGRMTIVGDDVDEIATSITEAIKRKPWLIITTGGLGPTFDDKTLEGVAKALDRELEINEDALKLVKEKYESYAKSRKEGDVELTQARVKMARLPKGAQPLRNPVGTAPGVTTEDKETVLIALPGVPSEMEAIFEDSIVPLLRRRAGDTSFFETSIFADDIMESTLAPLIDQTMHDNPQVYIKSHPKGEETTPHVELHLSMTAKDPRTARACLGKTIIQLSDLIEKNDGRVRISARRLQHGSGNTD